MTDPKPSLAEAIAEWIVTDSGLYIGECDCHLASEPTYTCDRCALRVQLEEMLHPVLASRRLVEVGELSKRGLHDLKCEADAALCIARSEFATDDQTAWAALLEAILAVAEGEGDERQLQK